MKKTSNISIHPGTLKIEIVEANLTWNVETFSKMDPYVQADWTDQTSKEKKSYKTKQIDEAGKVPNWRVTCPDQNSFSLEVGKNIFYIPFVAIPTNFHIFYL